ncbi:MAG: hypothetical protein U7123_25860 [Potamolinea sp.]
MSVMLAVPFFGILAFSLLSEQRENTKAFAVTAVQPTILTFNSKKNSDNGTFRTKWLTAIGTKKIQCKVDFESGFKNNQNISGIKHCGGLVIKDTSTANAVIIKSGNGSIGGSNPVGVYSATHNEKAYLVLDFSAKPVDYVAFLDIDQTATGGFVEFVNNTKVPISFETTAGTGNSAEFFGIFRNNMPRIKRVLLDASGDGLWGIDNIEYGVVGY